MPISDDFKLLFVHIPKNAGSSLEKSLNARETSHKSWAYYRDNHPQEWGTYINFAVLRDPMERLVSCYNYARMKKSFGIPVFQETRPYTESIQTTKYAKPGQ